MLSLKGIIILSKSYWYYTSMVVCIIMEMLSLKGIIILSKSYWCYTSMVVCVYYVLPISNYNVSSRNKITIIIICYFPCLSKDKILGSKIWLQSCHPVRWGISCVMVVETYSDCPRDCATMGLLLCDKKYQPFNNCDTCLNSLDRMIFWQW